MNAYPSGAEHLLHFFGSGEDSPAVELSEELVLVRLDDVVPLLASAHHKYVAN